MLNRKIYLGIETSCDETSVAIVAGGREVLSNELYSQAETHGVYGGVVPEIAAREHVDKVNDLVEEAMAKAHVSPSQLSGIACTAGPGFIGSLLVGMSVAKSLCFAWNLPLLAVDHLEAHVCANYLNSQLAPPFTALLVSGGHTQLMHFEDYRKPEILGQTRDDAAGEAYDKVARLLGLGYPGGPAIDRLAQEGNPLAYPFPEAMPQGLDFSFSGLKTAVWRRVEQLARPLPVHDLCAGFQRAVVAVLVKKTLAAQALTRSPKIVLAGGVAANKGLRSWFEQESPVPVYYPEPRFCTDNAAMVASAGYFCGAPAGLDASVYARRPRARI